MNGSRKGQTVLVIRRASGIARAVTLAARDAGASVVVTGRQHPVSRIGTAHDIADGVLFVMTSTFLTGQTLHIDSGEPLT